MSYFRVETLGGTEREGERDRARDEGTEGLEDKEQRRNLLHVSTITHCDMHARAQKGPKWWGFRLYMAEYIYIHIYIYICCGVTIWAKFGQFDDHCQGQVFDVRRKHYERGVSTHFSRRRSCTYKFLGQVGHFFCCTNLAQIIAPTWPR